MLHNVSQQRILFNVVTDEEEICSNKDVVIHLDTENTLDGICERRGNSQDNGNKSTLTHCIKKDI